VSRERGERVSPKELLSRIWSDLTGAPSLKPPLRESDWCITISGGPRVLLSGPRGELYELLVQPVDASDPDARLIRAFEAGEIPEG
jgi:hypothetical protein